MSKVYMEYKDLDQWGEEKIVSGYFELVEKFPSHVVIKSGKNTLEIGRHRINKIKYSSESEVVA